MEKLPRKLKLKLLGRVPSKRKINEFKKYWTSEQGFPLCHKCGCGATKHWNHRVPYPEVWIDYKCARCGTLVAYQDNSPLRFVIEEE